MPGSTDSARTPEDCRRDLDIADAIFRELGGLPGLKLDLRARNLSSVPRGVTFQFCGSQKFNHVRITLENDRYNLQFYQIRRSKSGVPLLLNEEMLNLIRAEDLRQVFEKSTGLVLGGIA